MEENQSGNNTFRATVPLFLAIALIGGVFIGNKIGSKNSLASGFSQEEGNTSKLTHIIDYIEENYVDSVNKKELIDGALESILTNLDPHSSYSLPDETKTGKEQLEGSFQGIGIEFMILRDSLVVLDPIADGPSIRAGLQPGDRIIEVDGVNITGDTLKNDLVLGMLKGPGGTDVHVKVKRRKSVDPLGFTITRGRIPIESVVTDYMVDESIGYIKVVRFAQTTAREFSTALSRLEAKGATEFILDLRSNGGGLLSQAIAMSEEFLDKKDLIVFTEGVHQPKEEKFSRRSGKYKNYPLAVLINESSASASEIVSGALQDHDRAVIVGRRSFGKGLVQNQLDLLDHSSIRLTIARYYTPSGRCIQKPYGEDVDYNDDYENRFDSGELFSKDSIHYADTVKYYTAGKRIVYSGGGISPDLFVPLDTTYASSLLNRISYNGLIRRFGFDKADKMRNQLKNRYEDSENFVKNWHMTKALWQEFVDEVTAEGFEYSVTDLSTSEDELKLRIKAQIGKYVFGNEALYRTYNSRDKMIQAAQDNILKELNSMDK